MPAEFEAPTTPVSSPAPAAPPTPPPVATEPEINLDTAFSDAAAAQSTPPPAAPAPQAPAPQTPGSTAAAPATPAAPHSPSSAPSVSPSLLTRAQAANLPLEGIQSDADLAQALFDYVAQINPYAQLGRQQLAQQQAPAAPTAPAAPAEPEWSLDSYFAQQWQVPEWKPEYQHAVDKGLVTADANGNIIAAPGAEALVLPILSGMNAALAARQEAQQRLFSEGNPLQNIYQAIEEPLVRKFEQMLEQRFSGYQQTQQQVSLVDKFEQDNAAWLYDQSGQPTAQGQAFIAAVQQLRQSGVNDPQRLMDWGLKIAGVNPQAAPPAAPPAQPTAAAAAPGAERARDPATGQFLKADAAPTPPVAPAAPAAPAPSKQESFLESARKRAGHSPSRQDHSGANPDEPVSMEQGDLDSFFNREFQARRQAAGVN